MAIETETPGDPGAIPDPGGPGRLGNRAGLALRFGLFGGLGVLVLVGSVWRLGPGANSSPAKPPPTPTMAPAAFLPTGSMLTARIYHTATLLRDGRVLIAGGAGTAVGSFLASAELYEPATGTFAATGAMSTTRVGASATMLVDGRVLIAGGQAAPEGFLASAELYDPISGTFRQTGSMSAPRLMHSATLLPDRRILIAGGMTRSGPVDGMGLGDVVASAELYDPRSGTFTGTGSMLRPRAGATEARLGDGRVLIAGGAGNLSIYGGADSSAELYDPGAGTFGAISLMSISRLGATATLLVDGRVLIAGGNAGAVDVPSPQSSAELFDPAAGTFRPAGSMAFARYRHTATILMDGRVLMVGGGEGRRFVAELFDPATSTFGPAELTRPILIGGTATRLQDGRVLLAGGSDGAAVASAMLYQP